MSYRKTGLDRANEQILIRTSTARKKWLQAAAERAGVTLSEYLLESAIERSLPKALRRRLSGTQRRGGAVEVIDTGLGVVLGWIAPTDDPEEWRAESYVAGHTRSGLAREEAEEWVRSHDVASLQRGRDDHAT
jgi:hypothetical protein